MAAILTAAILHASWNAIAKGSEDRTALLVRMTAVGTVLAAPVAVTAPPPARASWSWLGFSVLVHVAYALTLTVAYRYGDFNQAYPIARGLGPVLVAVAAVVVLDESLTPAAVAGVLLVAVGAVVIGHTSLRRGHNVIALGTAFLTATAIAGYTIVDGVGVRASGSPVGYAAWLMVLQGPLTAAWVAVMRCASVRRPGRPMPARRTRPPWRVALIAGALSGTAYGLVLWAQTRASLAGVAALRETSIVFAAVIGATVFREPAGRSRTFASCLIAGGGVLLALGGG
jgi:drug/metabolite transporter (DMT)-like permease